jgi:hypothetical protein
MQDLFDVHTVTPEFSGHRNVCFFWCWADRREKPTVPYSEAIYDYDPLDGYAGYAQEAVDELLRLDEAMALKAWLDRVYRGDNKHTIKKVDLPMPSNVFGQAALPWKDSYPLYKEPGYDLPFKVIGYFDLCDHERVDSRTNVAEWNSKLLLIPGDPPSVVRVREELERLLAEHPDWTSERALAHVLGERN